MTESIKIVDIVVEYTDEDGIKTKIAVVLNEIVSNNLGEFLDINDYKEKIKNMIKKKIPD
jgi:hypothetical protein